LFFGVWWGGKFKKIYLDPWPADYDFNSVFMRMTASNAKPFYAMEFITDNNISGNMFNYWTEGGFIAWAQNPDPNTGKTPLQLFMDGRAQAAYEPANYKKWASIMAGGPQVSLARRRHSSVNYEKVAAWLEKQLEQKDVWVVMMPSNQFDTPLVKGLLSSSKWFEVFINDKQKILVNIRTERGKELFQGILRGTTEYPDEYHTLLNKGYMLLRYISDENGKKQGLELMAEALKIKPSRTSMMEIVRASRYKGQKQDVMRICSEYLNEFNENKDEYRRQHGYHNRLVAGLIASNFLERAYRKEGHIELSEQYKKMYDLYMQENSGIIENLKW
jgi:hypothetical protein